MDDYVPVNDTPGPSAADLDAVIADINAAAETSERTGGLKPSADFDVQDAVNNLRQGLVLLRELVFTVVAELHDTQSRVRVLNERIAKYNLGAPHKI